MVFIKFSILANNKLSNKLIQSNDKLCIGLGII